MVLCYLIKWCINMFAQKGSLKFIYLSGETVIHIHCAPFQRKLVWAVIVYGKSTTIKHLRILYKIVLKLLIYVSFITCLLTTLHIAFYFGVLFCFVHISISDHHLAFLSSYNHSMYYCVLSWCIANRVHVFVLNDVCKVYFASSYTYFVLNI